MDTYGQVLEGGRKRFGRFLVFDASVAHGRLVSVLDVVPNHVHFGGETSLQINQFFNSWLLASANSSI